MRHRKIAIIGGSLVGPSLYRFLDRSGIHDVTIFEMLRRPHSQSGGVMGLRPDTLASLSRIGVKAGRVAALSSEQVAAYDITAPGVAVYRGASLFPGTTTSWDAAYSTLGASAPVEFSHRLTAVRPDGHRYLMSFANGTEVEADVVVFADGRKSTGRELIDPSRALRYNGYTIWRGLAEPPSGQWRPRGFERFYDAEAGRLFSVTGPLLQSGKSYWELSHNLSMAEYVSLTRGREPTDLAYILPNQITDAMRDTMVRAADRLPAPLQDMVADGQASGIPVNDIPMPTRAAFTTDGGAHAVLLGDALIPVRLQVGAGLNQGVLQAEALAEAVTQSDLPTALQRWSDHVVDRLGPIVEVGRHRAHNINLGWYQPVRLGQTAVPDDGPFGTPHWVTA